jgi:hypothetical protein
MNKLLHQSIVVYLAVIILLRMMAMPLSLLDYSLNRQFIAGNLCENRTKTEMHCGGSCYLNKQLARSNESQESSGQKTTVKNVVLDYFEPIAHIHIEARPQEQKCGYPAFASVVINRAVSIYLRPPIA